MSHVDADVLPASPPSSPVTVVSGESAHSAARVLRGHGASSCETEFGGTPRQSILKRCFTKVRQVVPQLRREADASYSHERKIDATQRGKALHCATSNAASTANDGPCRSPKRVPVQGK